MIKLVVDENDKACQELVNWVNEQVGNKDYLVNLVSKQSDPIFCESQKIVHFPTVYGHTDDKVYRGMDFVKQYLRGYFRREFKSM